MIATVGLFLTDACAGRNYKACNEAFFAKAGIPRSQIYTVDASLTAEAAAVEYTAQLRSVFSTTPHSTPSFDLVRSHAMSTYILALD